MRHYILSLLTAVLWIQYELPSSTNAGFIDATVTGDSATPPPIDPTKRGQIAVAPGTLTTGMFIDSTQSPPTLAAAPVVVAPSGN